MKRVCCGVVLALLVLGCQTRADARNGTASEPTAASQSNQAFDLASVPDGTYVGSHSTLLVAATVEITVVDHAITAFEVTKHRCGKGEPAEAIAERVLERQTLAVDVVSGASASSRVILKAAEKALASAKEGPARQP